MTTEIDFFEIQIGKETVWGTAVPPTAKLAEVEECTITPEVEAEGHAELSGSLSPAIHAAVNRKAGRASLSGIATYEQLPYLLDSLLGEATPSAGPPHDYAYLGAGAKPTPRQMTLVKGNPSFAEALISAILATLELEFATNVATTFSAEAFGYGVQDDALETLTDATVNILHGNDIALYIDDWAGTIGATEFTGVAFTARLGLDVNRDNVGGLGSVNPKTWKQQRAEPGSNQLMLSLEYETDAKAYLTELLGVTREPFEKQVRILSQIDANHICQIDFAGFAEEAPELHTDEDGVATLEFTLSARHNVGLGGWLAASITNEVVALP